MKVGTYFFLGFLWSCLEWHVLLSDGPFLRSGPKRGVRLGGGRASDARWWA